MKMRNAFTFLSPSHPSHASSSPYQHNLSEAIMEEKIQHAEKIIKKWDLDATPSTHLHYASTIPSLFTQENHKEAQKFIDSVTDLQTAMHSSIKENPTSEMLIRAQNLMHIAVKRLEKEFHSILKSNQTILHPVSVSVRYSSDSSENEVLSKDDDHENASDHIQPQSIDSSSEVAMRDLKIIADCMIYVGYGKECFQIYKIIRKSLIDETLYYLGVEHLSFSQIQKMGWDVLEEKVKKWLSAVKTAVKSLFHGERILCDHVFSASDKIRESCFAGISRDNALTLLGFAENLAKCKKLLSPEKMFRFLDIYEAISDLWIEIELIFSFESLSVVKSQAVTSVLKLGEAIRTMLSQFESAIEKDSSKTPVPGGGVHPLTRYVMNYLVFLMDYSGTVADIVADWPISVDTPLPESYFSSPASVDGVYEDSPASAITFRLARIIFVLLCKLDAKARLYREHVALSYLFLANNLNYVVGKVKSSNLMLLIGSDWISKHESVVKRYSSTYERKGWDKVMASLPDEPTAEISFPGMKEALRKFNSGFEEEYRIQRSWVIPDSELRNQIRVSLSKKMVPAYRAFYEKHRNEIGGDPIVRFAPEDLENYLSSLFHWNGEVFGSSGATSYRGSSVSTSPSSSHGH